MGEGSLPIHQLSISFPLMLEASGPTEGALGLAGMRPRSYPSGPALRPGRAVALTTWGSLCARPHR